MLCSVVFRKNKSTVDCKKACSLKRYGPTYLLDLEKKKTNSENLEFGGRQVTF